MRSRRSTISRLSLAMLILGLATAGWADAQSSPEATPGDPVTIRLAVSSWVGYGPLWLAEERGYFDDEGVAVDLNRVDSDAERIEAMQAGGLDAGATTVDTWALFAAQGGEFVQVLAVDESTGGDGIVATREIATIADLAGKTIAVPIASPSQFLLATALDEAGLALNDVNVRDMPASDAGVAFVVSQVDAAVTWQPWLLEVRRADIGHILFDTKQTPGLIVDTVAFRPQFVEGNPEAVAAFIRGYYRAVEEIEANPDAANAVMAESLGMETEDFVATLADLRVWGAEGNTAYFGTLEQPGAIYALVQQAGAFYAEIGVTDNVPDPKSVVDPSFVDGAAG